MAGVEQAVAPDGAPLSGSTRLADGFMAAQVMRAEHPEAFDFFCRAPIPFQHRATHGGEGVHLACRAPVFRLSPDGERVVGFRYNETDRAPLDTLTHDDVGAFYRHVHTLHSVLHSVEMPLRLEVRPT